MNLLCFSLIFALTASWALADWPTYRNDANRSGYTTSTLSPKLSLRWSHQTTAPPQPAWPRSARMQFDRAFHPIIAQDLLFFGSSADNKIHALNTTTGMEEWTFTTEGPIRFAPAFHKERLYVGSDDGYLYCLNASDGDLIWKKRGGPDLRTILGNGRIISLWPVRGGPVILNDIVYFAAGIWPSDGIHIYALNALTGKTLWLNDEAGSIYMGQPHGGANANSGVSAQGYLIATPNQLFLPTGRSVPAAFDRTNGAFQYFHLQANGQQGGSAVTISDRFFINSGIAFDQASGNPTGKIDPGPVTATPDGLVCSTTKELVGYQWIDAVKIDRKGGQQTVRGLTNTFKIPLPERCVSTIATPEHIVTGASKSVSVFSRKTGDRTWHAQVDGNAYGLAIAGQRLYVSTDRGTFYCFDSSSNTPQVTKPEIDNRPYGQNGLFARAAREIIEASGITKGYCLDLACGEGQLALELAQRTDLHIIALEADAQKAAIARAKLTQAGLYGTRVTLLERDLADLPIYFANLIVSSASVSEPEHTSGQAQRLLRPYGGILCLGQPGSLKLTKRGPLKGAGSWTHQYANAANTACSDDDLLKGPLRMLWFADVGQQMTQRHGRAPAPLFNKGILYSEGLHGIVAVDAYNGHTLWEYEIPDILKAYDGDHLMGASGTGSNYCLSEDSLYVRTDDHCLRLDARTGKLLAKFASPKTAEGGKGTWGYISYDDGILYGSLANPDHVVTYRYLQGGDMKQQLTESTALFALDAKTGQPLWRYDAKHSIRHNSIAIGAGYVVVIDRPLALTDRVRGSKATNHVTGELVALYPGTGKVLWRNNKDIYGTLTTISPGHQKIIMGYQPTRFRLDSELGGRISCFDLATGQQVWQRKSNYSSRPMVNGNTVYAQGGAWDLFTGEDRPFNFQRSYGCGILASAKELMVFRSATLGYFDLKQNRQSQDYGGVRPGCWINVIPAGGLVFAPDASAGCKCSYQNQAWIALQPADIRPPLIKPAGETATKPFHVELLPDSSDDQTIHYTLDGSSPTTRSARYTKPILIAKTGSIRARAFDKDNHSSTIASASFTVDEHLIPLHDRHWTVYDSEGAVPASHWSISQNIVEQTANTFLNTPSTISRDPGMERPGTIRLYNGGTELTDGELTFEIRSSDDDGVGVAFRAQDAERYYLWSMHGERRFRSLTVKDGGNYKLLASNLEGYQSGKWYQVRIILRGPRITIEVDGEKDLEAEDSTFTKGSMALYSWGNSGVQFKNLSFQK